MNLRKLELVIVAAAAVTAAGMSLWKPARADDATMTKPPGCATQPYQVLTASSSQSDYQLLYVLDNPARRLIALKYDRTQSKLVPIGGRVLPKDFGVNDSGEYSMATMQLSGQQGLLVVTDHVSRRCIVYAVDLVNNRMTPQEPVELKALFPE